MGKPATVEMTLAMAVALHACFHEMPSHRWHKAASRAMTTGRANNRRGICTKSIGTPALARIGCITLANMPEFDAPAPVQCSEPSRHRPSHDLITNQCVERRNAMAMANITNRQPLLNAGQTKTGRFQYLGGVRIKHNSAAGRTAYQAQ